MDETAEIILIGEQLADAFSLSLAESGLDLEVAFEWEIQFDTSEPAEMVKRFVTVMPTAYRPVAPASRKDNNTFDVDMSILIVEKYTGSKPKTPKEWVNERVTWVQEKIFNPLVNTENPLMLEIHPNSSDIAQYWSQTCEVTEVCAIDWLRHNKIFWSEVEATFRRIK